MQATWFFSGGTIFAAASAVWGIIAAWKRAHEIYKIIRRIYEFFFGKSHSISAHKESKKKSFRAIDNSFTSILEVQDALRAQGLESSDLIIFADFTKSNEWAGRKSFNGRSLHSLDAGIPNPYQQVISIVGQTLSAFDDDRIIPAYGFGDNRARDNALFSFLPDGCPVHGLENVLQAYEDVARSVCLSGGTSFAPAINKAISIVIESGFRFHIALIIADGQVSPECMKDTTDAIVRASHYPLSIVMVGVGDGPWGDMHEFDDNLPTRAFDNFQFVDFTQLMYDASRHSYSTAKWEACFALQALMEVPHQYGFVKDLRLMEQRKAPAGHVPPRVQILEPPAQMHK